MDIPNTGAIFTLGKSNLTDNSQSYFYIKNDPVKRLVSGPYQSAVICESGRLFVWGENHYGQLGIDSSNNKNSIDVITKPTCVKSLKVLGLKIKDIAFGNDWAVMLSHSNELFFTGRNIFPEEATISSNFFKANIHGEECQIVKKPIRLEAFDMFLSKNEEVENYESLLAGNEHFVVLTTSGRLIGWGAYHLNQMGSTTLQDFLLPQEFQVNGNVQQYTCGPESTMVLTDKESLYITGQLNEFMFMNLTELQKNLTTNEKVIFTHISKANEIFILTNSGSIYKSFESVRNKSLIFNRFYDYDTEEHGPIWKLLKGHSFCAVLTKANKFFTTFSESGHHLNTFREISKFKNLRLMDMAVGNQHILVHGVPRSSITSAKTGNDSEQQYVSRSLIMIDPNGTLKNIETKTINDELNKNDESGATSENIIAKETATADSIDQDAEILSKHETLSELNNQKITDDSKRSDLEQSVNKKITDIPTEIRTLPNNTNINLNDNIDDKESLSRPTTKSSTNSFKSQLSLLSRKVDVDNNEEFQQTEELLESNSPQYENRESSTAETLKKIPSRNFSYEIAMDQDILSGKAANLMKDKFSPDKDYDGASLSALVSTTLPSDEEQHLDQMTNEIRFINDGIDVTENMKNTKSIENYLTAFEESLDNETVNTETFSKNLGKDVINTYSDAMEIEDKPDIFHQPFTNGTNETLGRDKIFSAKMTKAATIFNETLDDVSENAENAGKNRGTVGNETTKTKPEDDFELPTINHIEDNAGHITVAEDDERTTASAVSNKSSSESLFNSSKLDNSINDQHDDLNDIVERSKQAMKNDMEKSQQIIRKAIEHEKQDTQGKLEQFFNRIRPKANSFSCTDHNAIDDEANQYIHGEHKSTPQHDSYSKNSSRICSIL